MQIQVFHFDMFLPEATFKNLPKTRHARVQLYQAPTLVEKYVCAYACVWIAIMYIDICNEQIGLSKSIKVSFTTSPQVVNTHTSTLNANEHWLSTLIFKYIHVCVIE